MVRGIVRKVVCTVLHGSPFDQSNYEKASPYMIRIYTNNQYEVIFWSDYSDNFP